MNLEKLLFLTFETLETVRVYVLDLDIRLCRILAFDFGQKMRHKKSRQKRPWLLTTHLLT